MMNVCKNAHSRRTPNKGSEMKNQLEAHAHISREGFQIDEPLPFTSYRVKSFQPPRGYRMLIDPKRPSPLMRVNHK